MSLFPSIVCTIAVFSFYGEYAVRSFLPDVFFYLMTTGWIFYVSLRENSVNQPMNEGGDFKTYRFCKGSARWSAQLIAIHFTSPPFPMGNADRSECRAAVFLVIVVSVLDGHYPLRG